LQKDLADIDLPGTITMDFPNPDDVFNFTV
jgi:hypothetical protein